MHIHVIQVRLAGLRVLSVGHIEKFERMRMELLNQANTLPVYTVHTCTVHVCIYIYDTAFFADGLIGGLAPGNSAATVVEVKTNC